MKTIHAGAAKLSIIYIKCHYIQVHVKLLVHILLITRSPYIYVLVKRVLLDAFFCFAAVGNSCKVRENGSRLEYFF